MRWTSIGLAALGVVSATAAAVLVAALGRPAGGTEARPDVSVVVAVRDLPAMTALRAEDLVTRNVQPGLAPAGSFRDPLQVIGKVLTAPVAEGQAFSPVSFVADGSAMRLAASLPEGRRAVSVGLDDDLSVEGLLYPGSVVDVLATMRLRTPDDGNEPVTVTLLQGVTVLGVADRTVVSPEAAEAAPVQEVRDSRRPRVTLLVDSKQAEMLKLAMEEGSVSLVLRNPRDTGPAAPGGTDLSSLVPGPAPSTGAPVAAGLPLQRSWQVVVLRGGEREDKTIDLPNGRP